MNKQTFVEELRARLAALPEDEREKLIDYYGEMIDDRVEEGLSEEEAVAALGDAADIAGAFLDTGARSVPRGEAETVTALRRLSIRVQNADVSLVREPLENGAAAQVRFSDPSRFEWRSEGEALEIVEPRRDVAMRFSFKALKDSLSLGGLKVTVALAEGLPGDLEFDSNGGDLTAEGVSLGGSARLHSVSGDFTLRQVACAGMTDISSVSGDIGLEGVRAAALSIKTVSGDINVASPTAHGALVADTKSGDVAMRGVLCGGLTVNSASGDIEIDRGVAGAASVRSASGDVRLDELETDPTLAVQTASGDVALTRCIARETRLSTASGDVKLRLEKLPCGYDITANTRSGDIRLPRDNPSPAAGEIQPRIAVNTMSGDIDAGILG